MRFAVLLSLLIFMFSCTGEARLQKDVQTYLDTYSRQYQKLYTISSEAEWKSNTYIVDGDSATGKATRDANEALARFTGSKENIDKARSYLKKSHSLRPIQVKQLQTILYMAANNPQSVPVLVKNRIKAETLQNKNLFDFNFQINGKAVTPNQIDDILKKSNN